MNANTKKKIEIGLWACNLVVFIIINLVALRKFHWLSMIIMAIPVLVTIFSVVKNKYVDWEKKSPSILALLISLGVYIVSFIIFHIPGVADILVISFSIIAFFSAVLSIILFIRFMIVYNRAFHEHQKELALDTNQRLYNVSIPVFLIFIVLIVWVGTVSVADKLATVNSPGKYEMVINGSDYEFFPDSLPENAKNKEFHYFPGFWLARSKGYVKFEATEEYLDEYELIHGSAVTNVTSIDVWRERHVESSEICKRISDYYLDKENCDIYVMSEGFSIQGYAINRNTNEIFIFYDGFD